MSNFKVDVDAKVFSNGEISLETRLPGADSLRGIVHRRIIQTEDQVIREALIKLGWTPPEPQQGDGGGE